MLIHTPSTPLPSPHPPEHPLSISPSLPLLAGSPRRLSAHELASASASACACDLSGSEALASASGGEDLGDGVEKLLGLLGDLELGRFNLGREERVELLTHAEQ